MATLDALINASGARAGAAEFDQAANQVTRSAVTADAAVARLDKGVANVGATLQATGARVRDARGRFVSLNADLAATGTTARTAAAGIARTGTSAAAAAASVDALGASSSRAAIGVRSLATSFTGVNAAAGHFLPSVGALVAAFAGFATLREGLGTFRDLERELTTLRGVSQANADEFERLSAKARQLGADTRFTATEAAEGLTFLARAGFSVQEQLDSVGAALDLAATSELTLAQAADVASNVLSTFGIATEEATRVVDDLTNVANNSNTSVSQLAEALKYAGPVAAATGKSLEETAAAIGVLGDRGIQASLAGTNIRGVLSGLLGPTEGARAALAELNLTLDDVDPSAKSLTQIFEQFGKQGLTAAQAVEIFGRRNAGAALILAGTTERVRELVEIQKENAGVTKELAEDHLDTLAGRTEILKSTWESFTESLVRNSGILTLSRGVIDATAESLRILQFAVEEVSKGGSFETVSDLAASLSPEIAFRVDLEETRRQVDAQQTELKEIFSTALAGLSTELDGRNNLAFAFDSLAPEAQERIAGLRLEFEALASSGTLDALDSDVQNLLQGIGRVADYVTLEINSSNEVAVQALAETINRMEGLISGSSIGQALKVQLRDEIGVIRKDLDAFNIELGRRRDEQTRIVEESNAALLRTQRLNSAGIFPGPQYDAPIGPTPDVPVDPTLSNLSRGLSRELDLVGKSADERERLIRVTEFASEVERVFGEDTEASAEIIADFAQRLDQLIAARNAAAAAADRQAEQEKAAARAVADAEREKARAVREAARAQEEARGAAARAATSIGDLAQRERDEIALLSTSASQRSAVAREIEIQRAATEGLAAALQIEDEAQRAAAVSRIESAAATARAVGAQSDALREAREAAEAYAGAVTRSFDAVVDKALEGTLTIRDLGAAVRGLVADIARVSFDRLVTQRAGNFIADKLTAIFSSNASQDAAAATAAGGVAKEAATAAGNVAAAAGAVGSIAAQTVSVYGQTVIVSGAVVAGAGGVAAGGGGSGLATAINAGALLTSASSIDTGADPTTKAAAGTSGFSASGVGSIFSSLFTGLGKAFNFGGGGAPTAPAPGSPPPPAPAPPPPAAPAPAPPGEGGGLLSGLSALSGIVGLGTGFIPASANSQNVGGSSGLGALAQLGTSGLENSGPTQAEVIAAIGEPQDLGVVGGISNSGTGQGLAIVAAEQLAGESFPNIIFGGQRGIFDTFLPKNDAGALPLAPVPGSITSDLAQVNPSFALLRGLSGVVPGSTPAGAVLGGANSLTNLGGRGFSEADLVTLQNTSLATGALGGVSIQASPEYINGYAPGFSGLGPTNGFSGTVGVNNATGGGGSALSGLLGLFNLGFFAKGGAFAEGRHLPVPVTAHALGNAFGGGALIDSPTLFTSQEGLNVAGEAGTEIIAPAVRDPRTGRLGVQVVGGGGERNEFHFHFGRGSNVDSFRKSRQHIQQETRAALQGLTRG